MNEGRECGRKEGREREEGEKQGTRNDVACKSHSEDSQPQQG